MDMPLADVMNGVPYDYFDVFEDALHSSASIDTTGTSIEQYIMPAGSVL